VSRLLRYLNLDKRTQEVSNPLKNFRVSICQLVRHSNQEKEHPKISIHNLMYFCHLQIKINLPLTTCIGLFDHWDTRHRQHHSASLARELNEWINVNLCQLSRQTFSSILLQGRGLVWHFKCISETTLVSPPLNSPSRCVNYWWSNTDASISVHRVSCLASKTLGWRGWRSHWKSWKQCEIDKFGAVGMSHLSCKILFHSCRDRCVQEQRCLEHCLGVFV